MSQQADSLPSSFWATSTESEAQIAKRAAGQEKTASKVTGPARNKMPATAT